MNKNELLKLMAEKTEGSKKEAQAYLDSFVEVVKEAVLEGKDVNVTGLGKFSLKENAAREGHNPKTGEKIAIPASRGLKFKASSTIKKEFN